MAEVGDPRSDRALIAAHAAGEPHAFDEIVRRHGDRLWVFALRTLDHREDAADAVQDALVRAFRSADGYRGESEVSTWLHRIVLNACLDRLRRRRARAVEPIDAHDLPGPRDPVDDHLTRLTVEEALALLPTGQRLPIILVDMQGFSIAEAADVLGVPEGTIKSRCARGRARLARSLGYLRDGHLDDDETDRGDDQQDQGNATRAADVEGGGAGVDRPAPEGGGRR